MDTIVSLQGYIKKGKSATLKIFRDRLLASTSGYTAVPGEFSIDHHGDILDIFEKNGMKVGIASAGDIPGMITNNLSHLQKKGCNIIFTACRHPHYIDGRRTAAAIEAFTNYIRLYKSKSIDPSTVLAGTEMTNPYNILDANELYQICEQLIK